MNLFKKTWAILMMLILTFSLAACKQDSSTSSESSSSKSVSTTVSAGGWEISISNYQKSDSLEDISTNVGYGGAVSSNKVSQKPEEGKVFLLVKMTAEKKEGSNTIDWSKLSLVDSDGNKYSRMSDEFLEGFGFKRMKGTTLSFGKNEGWIAFEVNKDSTGFKLQYDYGSETASLELKNS